METRKIEFDKLKHAYITVKHFLETESSEKITSLDNKIVADLGLSGDDNHELLEKFVCKFELDHTNFEYDKHFYSEQELFGSGAALMNLLTLSVWLPLKTIELLTLKKFKIKKTNFNIQNREVSDLTFKDLLTWYIEKEYKTKNDVKYEIQPVKSNN